MRTLAACLAILTAPLGAGCTDDHGLGEARQRWKHQAVSSYRVTSQRSCFCSIEANRPMVLEVASGALVQATYVDDQQLVDDSIRPLILTIDKTFDVVQAAIDGGADNIELEFDPKYGHPTRVLVDYDDDTYDEELLLRFSDLAPTTP